MEQREPVYSEWKPLEKAGRRRDLQYCPYCERPVAFMMMRYYTGRDGDIQKQYRIECPVCQNHGKTYMHESVALMSWSSREHDRPKEEEPPKKRRRFYIPE